MEKLLARVDEHFAAMGENLSPVARDLKLNLSRILSQGALDEKEATLALLATSVSVGFADLAKYAREHLTALDFKAAEIDDAAQSAAIMAMLNTYYRFRHMVAHEQKEVGDQYKNTGLRMAALSTPSIGKQNFEMLAFAVSVLNGCETCIKAHEKVLRDTGVSTDKIQDLARLAAVVKGIQTLQLASL